MGMDRDTVEKMMQEIGQESQDIDLVIQDDESSWGIQFADETTVHIEWLPNPPHIEIMMPIGEIEPKIRSRVCETLLAYNSLSQETNGARMAINAPGGDVVLLQDLYDQEFNLDELTNTLRNLGNAVKSWRHFLMGEAEFSEFSQLEMNSISVRA